MSTNDSIPTIGKLLDAGRFEWERVVARIVMPEKQKLTALLAATHADPDGTRVRPGNPRLAAMMGCTVRTVARQMAVLRDLGLLRQVSRGGGAGGAGNATEYRLTLPENLLDLVDLIPAEGPYQERPAKPRKRKKATATAQAYPESGDIQVSPQPAPPVVDSPVSPDIQVSSQPGPSVVDNSVSPDTQMSPQPAAPVANEMTSERVDAAMTGHFEGYEVTPGCPPTSHQPTTNSDQPSVVSQRNHRTRASALPIRKLHEKSIRCGHGLPVARRTDGKPTCPLCRRETPTAAQDEELAA